MLGIGSWELALFVLLVVLLFGGKRIPGLARSLGQSITEFKKGVHGIGEDNTAPENQETKSGSKSES